MVKVAPSVRPGQFIVYHAWENYQFCGQKGFQNLIPTPLNPVELAGGQFHLRPMAICLQPSMTDRDTCSAGETYGSVQRDPSALAEAAEACGVRPRRLERARARIDDGTRALFARAHASGHAVNLPRQCIVSPA